MMQSLFLCATILAFTCGLPLDKLGAELAERADATGTVDTITGCFESETKMNDGSCCKRSDIEFNWDSKPRTTCKHARWPGYTFVHDGHCASGWISGENVLVSTIALCRAHCAATTNCGYFAYSSDDNRLTPTNCALYTTGGGCADDTNYPTYNSYEMAPECPPAEQKTKEAGCCPLDRIYDDGKKCCPAGKKSSATGCTALPPPPPPPPPPAMLAEKTEETGYEKKYNELVIDAITALGGRNGASVQNIVKEIQSNYPGHENVNSYVLQALKRVVAAGKVVQMKGTGAYGTYRLKSSSPKKKLSKKPAAKKPAAKKPAAKKTPKKTPKKKKAKKSRKTAAKKTAAKKKAAKKAAKKPAAKKTTKKTPKKKKAKKAKKPTAKKN